MASPVPTRQDTISAAPPAGGVGSALVWGGTGIAALTVLAAALLWVHYGTTVFFEMVASGFAACF